MLFRSNFGTWRFQNIHVVYTFFEFLLNSVSRSFLFSFIFPHLTKKTPFFHQIADDFGVPVSRAFALCAELGVNLPLGVRSHLRVDEYHVSALHVFCMWGGVLCFLIPLLGCFPQAISFFLLLFISRYYLSSFHSLLLQILSLPFSLSLAANLVIQVLIEELELETGVTARKAKESSLEGVVASPGDVVSEWSQRGGDLGGFHRFDDQVRESVGEKVE